MPALYKVRKVIRYVVVLLNAHATKTKTHFYTECL